MLPLLFLFIVCGVSPFTDALIEKRSNYCPYDTECVPLNSCPLINNIIDERCIDNRKLSRVGCGHPGSRYICCPIQTQSVQNLDRRQYDDTYTATHKDLVKKVDGQRCGTSLVQGDHGYSGIGAYPWVARIGFKNTRTGEVKYPCTGSIIRKRVILTATHCALGKYDNYKLYSVRVGEWNTRDEIDRADEFCALPVQDIKISHIIKHSDYDNTTFSDTIALLVLQTPITYTVTAQPICLLEPWSVTNKNGLLIGWGKISGQRETPYYQQVLRIRIHQNNEKCHSVYGKTVPITDNQICAGGEEGVDACAGFAGAPLVVQHGDTFYQEGMMSFGAEGQCGDPDIPSVYTNVKNYAKWINENVPTYNASNNLHFDTNIPIIYFKTSNLDAYHVFANFSCPNFIIQHQTALQIFQKIEHLIKFSVSERFNKRKYLFLPDNNGNTTDQKLLRIFDSPEVSYVNNIVVIQQVQDLNDSVYNIFAKSYHMNTVWILDTWFGTNKTFLYNRNIFESHLDDQHGRNITLATFYYKPYSILEHMSTYDKVDGIETRLLLEFCKKYNFTVNFKDSGKELWGFIFKNFTGTGLLGILADDAADIAFCGIFTWEGDFFYLDHSISMIRTGVTCLVPAPRPLTGWFTPLYAFSIIVWIVVILSLFGTIVVLAIYMKYTTAGNTSMRDMLTKSFINIVRITLLQPMTPFPNPVGMKPLLASILITNLLITTYYNSGLSSIMTIVRYEKGVKTVEDLAQSEMAWGGTTKAWLKPLLGAKEGKYIAITKTFVAASKEQLEQRSYKNDFGYIIERLPHGNKNLYIEVKDGFQFSRILRKNKLDILETEKIKLK